VRLVRELHGDRVARTHHAAHLDDAHDPGLVHDVPGLVPADDLLQQAVLEVVDLQAGIAQAGDLHDRLVAEVQKSPGRQGEQVDAPGGDVLAEFARPDGEALVADFGEELLVNEVHLTQVRLGGVLRDPEAVLDGHAGVYVSLDSEAGQQGDAGSVGLNEGVLAVAAYCGYGAGHCAGAPGLVVLRAVGGCVVAHPARHGNRGTYVCA
jgi:hypothetical protein